MTAKVIFLDVDGTLVNDSGVVPDSARTAIQAARANGHRVFLCTGRSLPELWEDITSIGFDGVIAAAGGYLEYDQQILLHTNVAVADVVRAVKFFDAHDIEYFLEANSGLYGSPGLRDRLRALLFGGVTDETVLAELERGFGPFIDHMIIGEDPARDDINKISFLSGGATLAQVTAELSDAFTVIPTTVPMFGPDSGELSIPGVHKAGAIEVLLAHLGVPVADTMAYGDGHNDHEMLEHVAIGVAMGNAVPSLKAIADDVTGSPDEDGLLTSFTKHGLI